MNRKATVFILVITLLVTSQCIAETRVYTNNFDNASSIAGFHTHGVPSPQIITVAGRTGLDPNGDSWHDSGVLFNKPEARFQITAGLEVSFYFYMNSNRQHFQSIGVQMFETGAQLNSHPDWENNAQERSPSGERYFLMWMYALPATGTFGGINPGGIHQYNESGWNHIKIEILTKTQVKIYLNGSHLVTRENKEADNSSAYGKEGYLHIYGRSATDPVVIDDLEIRGGTAEPGDTGEPSGNGKILASYQKFYAIQHNLDEKQDLNAECKRQLGNDFRLADWNDIVAYHETGGSLDAFIAGLKMGRGNNDITNYFHISRDGKQQYGSNRRYFVDRHDHNKPSGFLAHANINNYHLTLGSWPNDGGFALCYNETSGSGGTVVEPPKPDTTVTDPPPASDTTVSISPATVASPGVGQNLTLSLIVANSKNVAGYQATVQFDTTVLRFVSGENGDFLPAGAFFVEPKVEGNLVRFNAVSLAGESDGDGTLAKFTFEVIAVKESTLTLSNVLLTNSAGKTSAPQIENAQITKTPQLKGDINGDGVVNIADLVLVAGELNKTGPNAADVNGDGVVNIADLVLVAGELNKAGSAPSLHLQTLDMLTAADVRQWLSEAQVLNHTDTTSLQGILFLQQLLKALTPKETALLANYPNPFNPETWIPYRLAKDAEVTLHIYAMNGRLVRTLTLGHQAAGMYQNRTRAAYWDGKNEFGEKVASGIYFYTLTTGKFSATRRMLILK